MIIRTTANARAAIVGNPSDGYFGKTIAFAFDNFNASVTLWESPELTILPTRRDGLRYPSIDDLVKDVGLFGYYGGVRLLKAAIKTFHAHAVASGIHLDRRNFTIQCQSDIPELVGLSGSSAIITAAFRALMEFYGVTIPKPQLANIIRAAEEKELGIAAGLQDRVVQVYGGAVYMDFDRNLLEGRGYGEYVPIDPSRLPPFYVAWRTDLSELSSVYHNNLKARYNAGDRDVLEAMDFWADLTVRARKAIDAGDWTELARIMDANFDRRAAVSRISPENLRMVEAARRCGVCAKFSGSGGAIVGICPDDETFARLSAELGKISVKTIRPRIAPPRP